MYKVNYSRHNIRKAKGYSLPIQGKPEIFQGYNGPWSHFAIGKIDISGKFIIVCDESYGLDFKLDEGSPVLAAKSGRVSTVFDRSNNVYRGTELEIGLQYAMHTNLIVIEHNQGFCSWYLHLKKGSANVKDGDYIKKGDIIAQTGESGWIGPEPHLHFGVFKKTLKRPYKRLTFPIEFDNYSGPVHHNDLETR